MEGHADEIMQGEAMKEYEELLAELDDIAERYELVINECGRLTRYIWDMQKEMDEMREYSPRHRASVESRKMIRRAYGVHRCKECPFRRGIECVGVLLKDEICENRSGRPLDIDGDLYRQHWCPLPISIGIKR